VISTNDYGDIKITTETQRHRENLQCKLNRLTGIVKKFGLHSLQSKIRWLFSCFPRPSFKVGEVSPAERRAECFRGNLV